jgi:nucleotide-binding universal stress UspA family protein
MYTIMKDLRNIEKAHLEELAEQYALTDAGIQLIKGHTADMIPSLVKNNWIDLVVMGNVGRSDINGIFIGNTAGKILSNFNCSVLAIKPHG